jgi:hypothetical protein
MSMAQGHERKYELRWVPWPDALGSRLVLGRTYADCASYEPPACAITTSGNCPKGDGCPLLARDRDAVKGALGRSGVFPSMPSRVVIRHRHDDCELEVDGVVLRF